LFESRPIPWVLNPVNRLADHVGVPK
jgi:hypothetical protein